MTNSTTARLSLEARVALEAKRTERDTQIARLNSARASHRADGADEMRLKVEESLLQIKFEEEGYRWIEARGMARQVMAARRAPQGVSA